MGSGSPRKFNPHEKLFTSSIRRRSVTRRLASAIAAEGVLDDSEPLGSGRLLSGCRYFQSAIIEVQVRVRTVIPYVANYSLAQFFVGLLFMGNARSRKLNSHENFCVYDTWLQMLVTRPVKYLTRALSFRDNNVKGRVMN